MFNCLPRSTRLIRLMAIMTSDANEDRGKLPQALRGLPVLLKPFKVEQVLRLPVLPLD